MLSSFGCFVCYFSVWLVVFVAGILNLDCLLNVFNRILFVSALLVR